MTKHYTLASALLFALFQFSAFCQTTNGNDLAHPPSKKSQYNITYKLDDESLLSNDSTILNDINLLYCDQFRQESVEVTVSDPATGAKIILFPLNVIDNKPKYWSINRSEH